MMIGRFMARALPLTMVAVLVVIIGPTVEAWLAPPIARQVHDVSVEGDVLTFTLRSEKFRPCQLVYRSFTWLRALDPEISINQLLGPDGQPFTFPVLEAGDSYETGPLHVVIPAEVVIATSQLRIVNSYRCWTPWTLRYVTIIDPTASP